MHSSGFARYAVNRWLRADALLAPPGTLEDVTEFYLRHFADSPSTLAALAGLALLAVVVALVVPRRRGLVLATGLSLALIGGLTLPPAGGWTTFDVQSDPWAAVLAALQPQAGDLTAWQSADGPANVLLFVPLGLTLGLLTRRPVLTYALGTLLSVAIESYQAATGLRVGVFADVVANSLGALIGAVGAALVLSLLRTGRRAPRPTPSRTLS